MRFGSNGPRSIAVGHEFLKVGGDLGEQRGGQAHGHRDDAGHCSVIATPDHTSRCHAYSTGNGSISPSTSAEPAASPQKSPRRYADGTNVVRVTADAWACRWARSRRTRRVKAFAQQAGLLQSQRIGASGPWERSCAARTGATRFRSTCVEPTNAPSSSGKVSSGPRTDDSGGRDETHCRPDRLAAIPTAGRDLNPTLDHELSIARSHETFFPDQIAGMTSAPT